MNRHEPEPPPTVFTIGHSNHPLETFLELLHRHGIALLADVRSSPYSRYTPYFNKESLQATLPEHGIEYCFLGDVLGGRPHDETCYDADGFVLYDRVAQSSLFVDGIARLFERATRRRTALMCSEEDPNQCHRRLLITRVLCGDNAVVMHIRGDGTTISEEELADQQRAGDPDRNQLTLFDVKEEPAWKSTRSVLPKRQPPSSSDF